MVKEIKIRYSECLINQDSVIVAGTPDQCFIAYVDSIGREANMYNIKLKRPWGAHITISRFLDNIADDKILTLLDIVKNSTEIVVSNPVSIDIGYFNLDNGKFNINVYRSIKL